MKPERFTRDELEPQIRADIYEGLARELGVEANRLPRASALGLRILAASYLASARQLRQDMGERNG